MSAPFRVRPFDFGEVFEIARPTSATSANPQELRLQIAALEAELALARQSQGVEIERIRAEAFEAGLAQARQEQAAAVLSATDALHAAVETIEAQFEDIADGQAREAAEVAHVAAELLAARTLTWAPAGAIDEAIGRVLRQVARGQEIHVAVHPGLIDAIEEVIVRRQASDRRRLALVAVADPAIAWGDAHIRWDQGGVILDAAARAASVRDALEPILPNPPATTTA